MPKQKSKFKFTESYTSLALGAIVVLIVGIMFFSFAKGNKDMRTSSTTTSQKEEQKYQEKSEATINNDPKTSSTYTIRPGDDLWSISENIYRNGYKWVEIAKINKLENPGLIHVGNKLMIPNADQKEPASLSTKMPAKPTTMIAENNSIVGNTYTIKKGDNLWNIAVRAYGDGFRWPEIAKVNNLEKPSLIFSGNILKLPR